MSGAASEMANQGAQWLQGMKDAALSIAAAKDLKKDEDNFYSPFHNLQKAAVLQECRCFNDREINPRKCAAILVKITWLLAQGDRLTQLETTDVFFGMTKLLLHKDQTLRRLIYLVMKELRPQPEEVIIVCATLTKDMNSRVDLNRGNAIRVLAAIIAATDPTMLAQIERHLKQALVDKNCFVATSALVAGIQLMSVNPEVVRRWVNEVQTALASDSASVQYHALALLHQIKRQDRLAVSKIVASLTRTPLKSALAHCLLIRFVKKVIEEDAGSERDRALVDFLEASLSHKSDIVMYEAASAICAVSAQSAGSAPGRELGPAITVLQLFLCSPKPSCRFAAVRTLNKVAMSNPMAVTPCNMDMEGLINDSNRSIATLAITTLLKTGSESSVERLMKQITSFMSEISDDFKIVVVDAIRTMCLKFPQKHLLLMTFLASVLREEGGFAFKRAIVDTLLTIIARVPEAKETGLAQLCEFIEDCEFTLLSTQILHLLGVEGPSTPEPSKYIRFIYNRVVLENATVRASAVSALAKFGVQIPHLRSSIIVLLQRCFYDNDDEVRDRAILYYTVIKGMAEDVTVAGKSAQEMIIEPLPVPLAAIEASCREYMAAPTEQPFRLQDVTIDAEMLAKVQKEQARAEAGGPGGGGRLGDNDDDDADAPPALAANDSADADLLSRMPEFVHVGARFTSSKRVALSEVGTEYEVTCTKHVYNSHILLQFKLNNTLEDQLLEEVTVDFELSGVGGLALEAQVPCATLAFGAPGTCFACLQRTEGIPTGSIPCTLKFKVKDVDPADPDGSAADAGPGYDDEYNLEDLELAAADFMKRVAVLNFKAAWENVGTDAEVVETFSLTYPSIMKAMEAVVDFLGMAACDGTGSVQDGAARHTVLLSGTFLGGMQVFAIVNLRVDGPKTVGMRLTVRSADMAVSQFVSNSVA